MSPAEHHGDDGTASYPGKEGHKDGIFRKSRNIMFLTVINAFMFLVSTAWFMIWYSSSSKLNADLRRVSSYSPSPHSISHG